MEHSFAHSEAFIDALSELFNARSTEQPPTEFWQSCLSSMCRLSQAEFGILLIREGDEQTAWRKVGLWPRDRKPGLAQKAFIESIDNLADMASQSQATTAAIGSGSGIAIRLLTEGTTETCIAAFHLPQHKPDQAKRQMELLSMISDSPSVYQTRQQVQQAKQDVAHFASALDLMVMSNTQTRFLAVALTVCNELAARHNCEQVSLGWLQNNKYVKLHAISRMEKFDRKMEAVKLLEFAMEECLDQDEEILLPRLPDSTLITRDHEKLEQEQGRGHLCSLPLRIDGKPQGVITCERLDMPFQDQEVRLLRICCDLATRRLEELKRSDRWFGARWLARARDGLSKLVGVDHTWSKIFGILGAVALGVLLFGRMNYRVEAPFILRSDKIQFIPAPFDGHIENVMVEVGDLVTTNSILLEMDTRDLLLEEAAAIADHNRYTREAEKARAAGGLAEMRISEALGQQAQARLDLVRFRLGQAEVHPELAGIIVEGDLKERLGAPIQTGEVLFRIADTDVMYVQCEVDERDIHELKAEEITGEIAFVGDPQKKYTIRVTRIDPVATPGQEGNTFKLRCEVDDAAAATWRPGMSGICKVNIGRRSILWVVSHKTVDFLRLKLWL
ncbi:MAG: hypothetical protein ACI9TH_002018 [Kiritimatiellia bacterium]|jgi:hypothetical protein